jgi:glutathione S-transferase
MQNQNDLSPQYILHYSPSTASLVVHWLLIELKLPHALKLVDLEKGEHKTPEYLALNPAGVVPTLMVDGVALCESAAIVMYLSDLHPEANLAPKPGTLARGHYYSWICLCVNVLMPAFRNWFYPDEAAGDELAVKAIAQARIEAFWQRADQHLAKHGPYLLGAERSGADFVLTMLMRWSRNMPKPAHTWPALGQLAARMKALDSFVELYRREGLSDWV